MQILLMILGIIALVGGLIVYSSISWGYVAWKFWYWFLLPVFPNLPHITFWQAVGLFFVTALFKTAVASSSIKKEYLDETQKYVGIGVGLLSPWITLFFAWLIGTLFF